MQILAVFRILRFTRPFSSRMIRVYVSGCFILQAHLNVSGCTPRTMYNGKIENQRTLQEEIHG